MHHGDARYFLRLTAFRWELASAIDLRLYSRMLVVTDTNLRHLRLWWVWVALWWVTGYGLAYAAETDVSAATALDALYEE